MAPAETKIGEVKVPAFRLEERLAEATQWDSRLHGFISNIRDFLFEHPVRVRGTAAEPMFPEAEFPSAIRENFSEWLKPLPPEARHAPADGKFLVAWQDAGGRFWQNLRDTIAPRKLPPLNVTSKPVPVRDIWSRNLQYKRVRLVVLAFDVLIAAIIIVPTFRHFATPPPTQAKNIQLDITPLDISPYAPKLPPGPKKAGGGGGGGEHNPIPASKGRLPKFSWTQFTPPAVKPPENPKLAMMPTVLGPPDLKLPSPNLPNWGDPLAKSITDSSGPGSGGGIGSGSGGGVGSGNGGGVGPGEGWGTGGGAPSAGTNGYGVPACVYCPVPTFSDEAVKTKYQGTVVLQVVITAAGTATNIHVVKGLGVGLDEKAVEAVRTWRFKPALGPGGHPAAVTTLVEVTFRLL